MSFSLRLTLPRCFFFNGAHTRSTSERLFTLPPKVMHVCYRGGGYIVFTRSSKVCMIQKRPKPPLLNETHVPLCLSSQKETQTIVHFFQLSLNPFGSICCLATEHPGFQSSFSSNCLNTIFSISPEVHGLLMVSFPLSPFASPSHTLSLNSQS